MPKSNSKAILELLEDGEILTRMEIYEKVGTIKGPSRISDLRSEGHDIDGRDVESKHGKIIKAYYMPQEMDDDVNVLYCGECRKIEKRQHDEDIKCTSCGDNMEITVPSGPSEVPF